MKRTLKIGKVDVTRIGLGTNRLTNTKENRQFLKQAVDAGVNFIDTAHLYTGGASEQTIGQTLAPFSDRLVLASKAGYDNGDPEVLRQDIEQSFQRLQTDHIPLFYLHRVDPNVAIEDSLAVLKDFLDRGKFGHVGISEVSIDQIEAARKVVPITAVQNHYNLTERKHKAVVDYCTEHDIVFVPFYPLHGETIPEVNEIANKYGATPQQITLAWLLKRSPAMLPIPGTLSPSHLSENLEAMKIILEDRDYQALQELR